MVILLKEREREREEPEESAANLMHERDSLAQCNDHSISFEVTACEEEQQLENIGGSSMSQAPMSGSETSSYEVIVILCALTAFL